MNTSNMFLIVGVIAAVVVGAMLFLGSGENQPDVADDSSGLIVGKNAIYVAEQAASKTILIAVVHLEKPGFVVIHENVEGEPGKILGASRVIARGETKNLAPIALSRRTMDGETIYAMLHLDDGDQVFYEEEDRPALDPVGMEPVMMIFTVGAETEEPAGVSL